MDNLQYIEYLEEMIATPGWSVFVEEAAKEIYQIQADALESVNWEELLVKRGRAAMLAELCNLEAFVGNLRVSLEEEADADI